MIFYNPYISDWEVLFSGSFMGSGNFFRPGRISGTEGFGILCVHIYIYMQGIHGVENGRPPSIFRRLGFRAQGWGFGVIRIKPSTLNPKP